MRFKIDENLPRELIADLQAQNHDAVSVPDQGLRGAPDSIVLARVRGEGRVLLTMDKGIGNVRAYPPEDYPGIVLFRPATSGRAAIVSLVRRYLPVLQETDLPGHLVVITDRGIRVR